MKCSMSERGHLATLTIFTADIGDYEVDIVIVLITTTEVILFSVLRMFTYVSDIPWLASWLDNRLKFRNEELYLQSII